MVTFTVRLRFAPEDHAQLVDILSALTLASRQEPGCDPQNVVIYEQYRDGAALEAHRASPHFKQYAIGGLYQLMKERTSENLTALL